MTKALTITFFGAFGMQNLGNELTLRAFILNARAYLPGAELNCVCTNAEATTAEHAIPAVLISYRYSAAFRSQQRRLHGNRLIKLAKRLVVRIPREIPEWLRAFRALKGTSVLAMTGTGMLSDFGISPFGLHYEILKWSIVARLRGCRLLFVSVGVGPIAHPLSRLIVKSALSLANYRSYRDTFAQEFLESIGFSASRDRVYPDLAFSLPSAESVAPSNGRARASSRVVDLGLMDYYGQHRSAREGERTYQSYVEGMARFAAWLLEQEYSVRLVIGDLSYDTRVRSDVLERLEKVAPGFMRDRIIVDPLLSAEQLDAQIAQADMVVATRFHCVLMALLRNRPVIALSYHAKVHSLMAAAGLADYCEDVDELDVQRLIERFKRLQEHADALRVSTTQIVFGYRRALDEQYRRVFGEFASDRAWSAQSCMKQLTRTTDRSDRAGDGGTGAGSHWTSGDATRESGT